MSPAKPSVPPHRRRRAHTQPASYTTTIIASPSTTTTTVHMSLRPGARVRATWSGPTSQLRRCEVWQAVGGRVASRVLSQSGRHPPSNPTSLPEQFCTAHYTPFPAPLSPRCAHLSVVHLALGGQDDFRREVGWRADARAGRRLILFVLGVAEIAQLEQRARAAVEQCVLKLDVPAAARERGPGGGIEQRGAWARMEWTIAKRCVLELDVPAMGGGVGRHGAMVRIECTVDCR
eukprot:121237-Chlamydomonas_euryale.AAC.4